MNRKNKYETPVIIPLGELVQGSGGGICENGGTVKGGSPSCTNGPSPGNSCGFGQNLAGSQQNCSNGSAAAKRCVSGAGV